MIVTVFSRKGSSIPTVIKQHLGVLSEEHTKLLAEEHKKELIKNIEESRDRVKKTEGLHLADSIDVEKIVEGDSKGYGVGNVNTINQKTPWMWWQNFGRALSGRTVPPGTDENPRIKGHFEPSSNGIFTKGQPKFKMNPKKAITAKNFIERTLGVMISKVRSLLK
jgi:hypothetical protein